MKQAWISLLPKHIRSKIEGRDNLQKVISNFGWLFGDRILRLTVGLFVSVWVARYLGTEQFGLFNFSMAFTVLFGPIAKLGLDNIVVREIVRYPEQKNEIIGTTFGLKILASILTIFLTMGAIFLARPNDTLSLVVVGIMSLTYFLQSFETVEFWFQSQVQSKYIVWSRNTAFLVSAILKVVLIKIQASLIAFVWLGLIENILGIIGIIIFYYSTQQNIKNWRVSFLRAKKILKDSYPLIFSAFAVVIYMKIDQVMLGEMLGYREVGIYSAAVKISEICYFLPVAISSSVTPQILKAREISQEKYYSKLQQTFNLVVILSYVISISITVLSPIIINTLFGSEYADSITILSIHIWASIFAFIGVITGIWLIAENLTMINFMTTTVGAIINVLLNFYLIPIYQGIGAAIATLVAYAIVGYFLCIIYPPLKPMGKLITNSLLLHGVLKSIKSKL